MSRLHTDREYEKELGALRERVLLMGSRVEEMVHDAVQAFTTRDARLARATSSIDTQIDRLEVDIDERCLRLLARRQPVAGDLRFITTALKLVTDLERIGDLASNICERTIELCAHPPLEVETDLPEMTQVTASMLRDCLDAFVTKDVPKAQRVMERDSLVDAAYAQTFPALSVHMATDPDNAQRLLSVARYLERIADHSTNIAEMVVFMVAGTDVRHNQVATGTA
ncbi:MAG: phosphate signaling complex protein PhoU [Polyangiaceae bacterium]